MRITTTGTEIGRVSIASEFAGRRRLTPGLPQSFQFNAPRGTDLALHGPVRHSENFRDRLAFCTTVRQPQGPPSASHTRTRMRLTLVQHDPLLVGGQLDS